MDLYYFSAMIGAGLLFLSLKYFQQLFMLGGHVTLCNILNMKTGY